MLEYLFGFLEEIGFSKEDRDYYLKLFCSLGRSDIEYFEKLQTQFFEENGEAVYPAIAEYADEKKYDSYGFQMLFLLYCSKRLKDEYSKKLLPHEMFVDIMKDLTYKNEECKKMYGCPGTFVFSWFHRHFLCKLFALGRFQFEEVVFDENYTGGGISLKPGDKVYNMHIPGSGEPLCEKIRLDSYKKAFEFFGFKAGDKMPITCRSWILYPDNEKIFDKNSNLYAFMCDFDIIKGYDSEKTFPDCWRIFYKNYNGSTKDFPKNTSLQKSVAAWLDGGGKIVEGLGIIVFDGEKAVN